MPFFSDNASVTTEGRVCKRYLILIIDIFVDPSSFVIILGDAAHSFPPDLGQVRDALVYFISWKSV